MFQAFRQSTFQVYIRKAYKVKIPLEKFQVPRASKRIC